LSNVTSLSGGIHLVTLAKDKMNNRSLLLGSAALLSFPMPAHAQNTQQPPAASTGTAPAAQPVDDSGDDEEIVIRGARPRGSVIGDIPPQNTLDARDVRATGATSITELLDALAPQIGSARGRGGEAPVLLLDGQRISGFRELRDIPTEAIQRVEILPEEVALKYGYRADQKVVNIVLRQRFRSTTLQAAGGWATDGGYASGNADVTRFLVQRAGRTTLNFHASGNTMLTEAERNIILDPTQITGTPAQELAARSLAGSNHDVRASATINRTVFGDVSGTINAELENSHGRSLIGLNPSVLEPLARTTDANSAHLGGVLNGETKSKWRWTVTGNADLDVNFIHSDRANPLFPLDRTRSTTSSGDIKGTANGKLFKLPAGDASTTLTLGGSTVHLDSSRTRLGASSSTSLSRTMGEAAINLDLPVSRRGREFSALGNFTINANAEDWCRRKLLAGRPPELHRQLHARGRPADDQPARRPNTRYAGLAYLRLHHRADGAGGCGHGRQPKPQVGPPPRGEAQHQLAAVREDRSAFPRRLRSSGN
jgi:hypothetical protein